MNSTIPEIIPISNQNEVYSFFPKEIEIEEPKVKLTIYLNGGYEYLSQLWIFDTANHIWYNPLLPEGDYQDFQLDSLWQKTFKLPIGNYIVRVKIDGQIKDNPIALRRDTSCRIGISYGEANTLPLDIPYLASAAPLAGNISYQGQDHYQKAAIRASSRFTFYRGQEMHSGLLIFLRFPSPEVYRSRFGTKAYWHKFAIYDAERNLISQFPNGTTGDWDKFIVPEERDLGYIGFSASLTPGLYFLEYEGDSPRTIPIYIYHGWYSQFFMMVAEQPLFATARVFISQNLQFEPEDPNHAYVDICYSKLQNNDFSLDRELLINIAINKFDSPMLGLLGAFIYLSSKEGKEDDLFRTIVHNLQNRILVKSSNSPDIYALNFLSYEHFGVTAEYNAKVNVKGTPMLRIAYDTLRRAASRYAWVMPEGGLNERISERQAFDSPFNSYSPLSKTVYRKSNAKERNTQSRLSGPLGRIEFRLENQDSLDFFMLDSYNIISEPGSLILNKSHLSNGDEYLPEEKERLQRLLKRPKALGWAGFFIVQQLLEDTDITSRQLAAKINIPVSTVDRLRKKWNI